jgi:hypothetical protein
MKEERKNRIRAKNNQFIRGQMSYVRKSYDSEVEP